MRYADMLIMVLNDTLEEYKVKHSLDGLRLDLDELSQRHPEHHNFFGTYSTVWDLVNDIDREMLMLDRQFDYQNSLMASNHLEDIISRSEAVIGYVDKSSQGTPKRLYGDLLHRLFKHARRIGNPPMND